MRWCHQCDMPIEQNPLNDPHPVCRCEEEIAAHREWRPAHVKKREEAAEERAKEEAADAYREADFKNNPNGYIVSPHVNSETTSAAFEAGWEARKRWEEENE